MSQLPLLLDGHCSGPLFAPERKIKLPVRPLHKAGQIHRAQTVRATPGWADRKAIREICLEAKRITASSGQQYVVDHIVPKISPWVCGLHVAANLQIITASENSRKSNAWWPDMWGEQVPLVFDVLQTPVLT